MKKYYGLIKDGFLIQKQPYQEKGFIEIPHDAICGQLYSNGKFETPPYKDTRTWKQKRLQEYPPIGDQLDAIMKWIATENEFTVPDKLKSIAMKCMSVKAKYPKPKEE